MEKTCFCGKPLIDGRSVCEDHVGTIFDDGWVPQQNISLANEEQRRSSESWDTLDAIPWAKLQEIIAQPSFQSAYLEGLMISKHPQAFRRIMICGLSLGAH